MKTYRPLTPVLRYKQTSEFAEITTNKPYKPLCEGLSKKAGRNNRGVITMRRRGGGHKRLYRIVDFKRDRQNIPAVIETIEYDPNRSCNIALIRYEDGQHRYIVAAENFAVGQTIVNKETAAIEVGNVLPLSKIPLNTSIHNIELKPGKGGQFVRSAGGKAEIVGKDDRYVHVKLPSGEVRLIFSQCCATLGRVGNIDHNKIVSGSAGRSRWLGKRPKVRGVVMNPVDHPMGGGEGKTSGGGHPVSPWGLKSKGKKTRSNKRTEKFIVSHRPKKRRK